MDASLGEGKHLASEARTTAVVVDGLALEERTMQRHFATVTAACLALAALGAPPALADEERPLTEMISPVSAPTLNEDPRIDTELRPMFMYTSIASGFATGGGHYEVAALQARVAITDRIGFIATKDGYVWLRPDQAVPDGSGWANIAFGFKGAVWKDEESASIFTIGLRYEAPWGNQDVLQGKGDGLLNPFISGAKGFDDVHVQLYAGPRIAISGQDSSFFDGSLHVDYQLWNLYPLAELNWVYVYDEGRRLPIAQEGFDLVDIGSSEAFGESVVTTALGLRYRVLEDLDLGVTGEFPLTSDSGIFGWRVTTDLIWRPMGWDALF